MPRGTVVHYEFVGLIYTIFNFCSFVSSALTEIRMLFSGLEKSGLRDKEG